VTTDAPVLIQRRRRRRAKKRSHVRMSDGGSWGSLGVGDAVEEAFRRGGRTTAIWVLGVKAFGGTRQVMDGREYGRGRKGWLLVLKEALVGLAVQRVRVVRVVRVVLLRDMAARGHRNVAMAGIGRPECLRRRS
jgi:hypothetical protein